MHISGAAFPWSLFGAVALVAFVTLKVFRFILAKTGNRELIEEGLILTENGIETSRFLIGKREIAYDEIERVQYVPFPKNLLLRMQYGPAIAGRVGKGPLHGSILIK